MNQEIYPYNSLNLAKDLKMPHDKILRDIRNICDIFPDFLLWKDVDGISNPLFFFCANNTSEGITQIYAKMNNKGLNLIQYYWYLTDDIMAYAVDKMGYTPIEWIKLKNIALKSIAQHNYLDHKEN